MKRAVVRIRVVTAPTACLIAAVLAMAPAAQALPPLEVSGAVGGHLPLASFADAANPGVQIGGGLSAYVTPRFLTGIVFDYHRNEASARFRREQGLAEGEARFTSWMLMASLQQLLRQADLTPYIKLQLGITDVDLQLGTEHVSPVSTHFSMSGGIGARWKLAPTWNLFAEGLFHRVFVRQATIPDREENDVKAFASVRVGASMTLFARSSRGH